MRERNTTRKFNGERERKREREREREREIERAKHERDQERFMLRASTHLRVQLIALRRIIRGLGVRRAHDIVGCLRCGLALLAPAELELLEVGQRALRGRLVGQRVKGVKGSES